MRQKQIRLKCLEHKLWKRSLLDGCTSATRSPDSFSVEHVNSAWSRRRQCDVKCRVANGSVCFQPMVVQYILWALPPSSSWCSDERRWDRGCAIKPFVRPEIFYRQQEAWWARTSPLFLSKIENICVRGGPELAEGEGEGGLSARCSLNHRRLAPPLVSRRRRLSVDLRILSEAKSTGRGRGKEPFLTTLRCLAGYAKEWPKGTHWFICSLEGKPHQFPLSMLPNLKYIFWNMTPVCFI